MHPYPQYQQRKLSQPSPVLHTVPRPRMVPIQNTKYAPLQILQYKVNVYDFLEFNEYKFYNFCISNINAFYFKNSFLPVDDDININNR